MKQIITVLFATGLLAALFTGCKEEYKTYSDREFVMFADTAATYMVLQDKEYFSVPVTSTVACDYDRTFGVEIIDKGSNAIEGLHYALRSNTITIKAGQRAANVEVRGLYDNIEPTDSLGFILKLVSVPRSDQGRDDEELPVRRQRLHGLVRRDLALPQPVSRH